MSDYNFFKDNLFGSIQTPVLNDGEKDITPRYRDIHFLITQKGLEALDPTALSKFLEPLQKPGSDGLQLTDDQLFEVVQSRYIQQPSDVQQFADYLKKSASYIREKYEDDAKKQKSWSDFVTSIKRNFGEKVVPAATSTSSTSV